MNVLKIRLSFIILLIFGYPFLISGRENVPEEISSRQRRFYISKLHKIKKQIKEMNPQSKNFFFKYGFVGNEIILDIWDYPETPEKMRITRLPVIKDLPVKNLTLLGLRMADFTSIKALPLKDLSLSFTDIVDLKTIKHFKLTLLNLRSTNVKDLTALRKMPLRGVTLDKTKVISIQPLSGMNLVSLRLADTNISDLSPLKGMKLIFINISKTNVEDLSPLFGMPLQELYMANCWGIKDLKFLAKFPLLEKLAIPTNCKNVEVIKTLPKLKYVTTEYSQASSGRIKDTVYTFWRKYRKRQKKQLVKEKNHTKSNSGDTTGENKVPAPPPPSTDVKTENDTSAEQGNQSERAGE